MTPPARNFGLRALPGMTKDYVSCEVDEYEPKEDFAYKFYNFRGLLPRKECDTASIARRVACVRWGTGCRVFLKQVYGKWFWAVYSEHLDGNPGVRGTASESPSSDAGGVSAGGDGTDSGEYPPVHE